MDRVHSADQIDNIKILGVNKNPIYQKILDFLKTRTGPSATKLIAGLGIWPERYYCIPDRAYIVIPGKDAVNSAYYYLKQLEKQGKVKQVYRGAWKIVEEFNPKIIRMTNDIFRK